mgnify:CR=1 FL=1
MAYTTIDDPTIYFETELYSGSSSDVTMNALSFQPDWVWLKKRSGSGDNLTYDSVRGTNKRLTINGTDAEVDRSSNNDELKSFNSDGWTLGTFNSNITGAGSNCVSWNWKAGGSASSNSDGSITSSVSANTTSGFSIVSYTGTGSNATVGHGLGAVPSMIITKARTPSGRSWGVYHASLGNTKNLYLDGNDAVSTGGTFWNSTTPTSSVFSVGTAGDSNGSTYTLIAYCFAEKKGYSKFGSYTGNDNADGTFIYTGFAPAWVMIKRTNSTNDWLILDRKRNTINPSDERLLANSSNAASTANTMVDFLSNGFKPRSTYGGINGASDNFIYMAFAESPFVNSNGIPNNAR